MATSIDELDRTSEGLAAFLQRCCADPPQLAQVLAKQGRLMRYREGDFLCHNGDRAECVWIVESGLFAMRYGNRIVNRGPGEIIGEQAFYRNEEIPRRGNDIETLVAGSVTIIDKALLDTLSAEQRSLWHQTVANALSVKLDQATQQRSDQSLDIGQLEGVLENFVCERGLEAAYAAIRGIDKEPIAPVSSRAIVWFSDLAGFSSHAQSFSDPAKVGESLKSLLDVQAAIIARAGGQIDKFIGDAVMAFWECPDEERWSRYAEDAVRAAVETADYFRQQIEAGDLSVDIRIGLHAGDIVIGNFGGDERIAFTLIGAVVNEAARYEQASNDNEGLSLGRVRVSDKLFESIAKGNVASRFADKPVIFSDKHDVQFSTFILSEEDTA